MNSNDPLLSSSVNMACNKHDILHMRKNYPSIIVQKVAHCITTYYTNDIVLHITLACGKNGQETPG